MQDNDIRHQKYLEPIVRFLHADLRMVLDDSFPESQKKHRLGGALLMLSRVIAELDSVNLNEKQTNASGMAAAVARIYEAETRISADLTERIINHIPTEMDEARLNNFLKGTEADATRNLLPVVTL